MRRRLDVLQTAGAVALVAFSLMIVAPSEAEPEALSAAELSALAATMDGVPSGFLIDMDGYLWEDGYLASDNEILYLQMISTLAYLWEDAPSDGAGEAGSPIPDPNGYLWSDDNIEFLEELW